MKVLRRGLTVVLVNVIVVACLLVSIELLFRLWHGDEPVTHRGLWPVFRPYVMFTIRPQSHPTFASEFTGERIPSTITTNALGFNDPHEFDYTKPYEKGAKEKVVLFTGASAAWGVGASATDKTAAGRMQYYLNNLQSDFSYTVINMAMGGYNAYQ